MHLKATSFLAEGRRDTQCHELRVPGVFRISTVSRRWEFDETWGYRHTMVVGDTGTVCNWDGVRADTNDLPTCIKETCGGHNEDDMLPFKIKV